MHIIPFDKLYNTDFIVSEPMAKYQYWHHRGNMYSAIGKPKVSHTLLWMKNCSATITDKEGRVVEVAQNQLAYTAKGTEYTVEFHDTAPHREDTVVVHFQLTDAAGRDIAPVEYPIVCMKNVDISFAHDLNDMAEEYRNNIVCVPYMKAAIYRLLTAICQKQKRRTSRNKYTCIRPGIQLLEQNSDVSIAEIAARCGVSECYFRRLFKEYSGESPVAFRQHYRMEKAKQLLLSDEQMSISDIAQELNFADIYHFSKTFKKYCGVSPQGFVKAEGE